MFTLRRVIGSSMEPTFTNGQIIRVSSLPKPKVGRIVIAQIDTKEAVKRIAKISGDEVLLMGDNINPNHNMTVRVTQIRGVVI